MPFNMTAILYAAPSHPKNKVPTKNANNLSSQTVKRRQAYIEEKANIHWM